MSAIVSLAPYAVSRLPGPPRREGIGASPTSASTRRMMRGIIGSLPQVTERTKLAAVNPPPDSPPAACLARTRPTVCITRTNPASGAGSLARTPTKIKAPARLLGPPGKWRLLLNAMRTSRIVLGARWGGRGPRDHERSTRERNARLPGRGQAAAPPDDPLPVRQQGDLPARAGLERLRRLRQAALRGASPTPRCSRTIRT